MKTSQPHIIWCAQSSWHYVVEGQRRYAMPLYLAIQVKEYLKNCKRNNDCVEHWVSGLSPEDRMLIKIIEQLTHISL